MTKPFRFTLLSKNASANHLVSHSCKNKGLKVPCFHTLTKNIRGEGGLINIILYLVRPPNHESLRLSPLISALTSKRVSKSSTSNTYKKQGEGEGALCLINLLYVLYLLCLLCLLYLVQSPVTSHGFSGI